ncbi:hypothetical protein COEREDRAFT_84921 [Coemansia reversa NRRL 1564]|uniref:Uncharacterized protein n=1 Tax=Coemansia reversa (strain ATCC 12441 / NRRL 1564) TaxID=763665 RepID=A0A2G5BJ33_COERN|nr:hypothetical protein COEREDRAFT_84919 [Coemansia reversa NRRL 1564]PIA18984.1 hypothetical protein COEREDRAFT_84921 [Coemansia reversa NRRL 1564]|eukprot:PIA18982.1 hypothetical protein COEREDRAFT_84919 [Coemansia reversa NRRL 1564]
MFIFDICYDMRRDLKQRRSGKRARVAAAAKRIVCFLSRVGEKPEKTVDATNNAAAVEVMSTVNMTPDDDHFDAAPICATPCLSLFVPASNFGHGKMLDLDSLFKCLDANSNSNESIDNASSGKNSGCVAVAMSSNVAMPKSDNSAEPVADFANILAEKAYFDKAPIGIISYQSLNGIASNFSNNGDYHDDGNPDVDIDNGCSDVSSTYIMSDGTSDILEINNADTEKQLELALAEAMNEKFFGSSLMENKSSSEPRKQYNDVQAMPFATAKLPMVDEPIEYAGWEHEGFSRMPFAF